MKYSSYNKKESSSYRKIFIIIFIFIFLFAILNIYFFKSINLKTILLNNFNFLKVIQVDKVGIQESDAERIATLQSQVNLLQNENYTLRSELGIQSEYKDDYIAVEAFSKASYVYGDIYLKQNSNTSLAVGEYVFSKSDIAVGSIVGMSSNTAIMQFLGTAQPFFAKDIKTDEEIELKASGIGMYRGDIGLSSTISTGDIIYLKGNSKAIIGTVVDVIDNGNSVKTLWIKTPYNIKDQKIFDVQNKK
jgi:cell shape-determining protein MreC